MTKYTKRIVTVLAIALAASLITASPAHAFTARAELNPSCTETVNNAIVAASPKVDLISYLEQNVETTPLTELKAQLPKYIRVQLFGVWVDGDTPRDCQNSRAEVLLRSSDPAQPLTYVANRQCAVATGLWHDPYSGQDFTDAIKEIQIDHVVPLHHAYLMGAHAWSYKKRCSYANYLQNDFHLLAVSGRENMLKLDRAPDQYMPPNKAFQCEYLHDWMRIKAIWKLRATPAELNAVKSIVQALQCTTDQTSIVETELESQRTKSEILLEACGDEPPQLPPARPVDSGPNTPKSPSTGTNEPTSAHSGATK